MCASERCVRARCGAPELLDRQDAPDALDEPDLGDDARDLGQDDEQEVEVAAQGGADLHGRQVFGRSETSSAPLQPALLALAAPAAAAGGAGGVFVAVAVDAAGDVVAPLDPVSPAPGSGLCARAKDMSVQDAGHTSRRQR